VTCIAKPRGFTDTYQPWADAIDNNPCGKKMVLGTGGYRNPLTDSPKGLWHLDEPSGLAAADSSGNNNNGVISGGVTLNQPGAPVNPLGKAMTFDGTGIITVAHNAALNLGDVFTLEAWVATTSLTDQEIIYKSGAYELELRVFTGTLRITLVKSGTQNVAVAGTPDPFPADGQLHHIAATKNGAAMTLWQDGVDITPNAVLTNATCIDSANPLTIGARPGLTVPMIGRIDEPAAYGVALAPAQIQSHARGRDLSADTLCPFHSQMKYGQYLQQPITMEP